MKVLILGARGNLGQDLVRAFGLAGHEMVGLDHDRLDVTDREAVRGHVSAGGYGAIVNAVAWNDVDGAEDPIKRELAWKLNVEVPGRLAELSREVGAAFVHYSSDFVFDGTKLEGYTEDDAPAPISVYGESKLAGEEAVRAAGGKWFVCRSSKLFGRPGSSPSSKPSFVNLMLKLAAERPKLTVVDEEVGSPTYTDDLAEATVRLVAGRYDPGVYHLVNSGTGVTWYGFVRELFGLLGVETPCDPVPASAFPRPARRPNFGQLLSTKFPPLRDRQAALQAFFAECPEVVPERFRKTK
ncbi:dTDP-4-dehydrorhamnose reductase [Candidatus Uhrbacteria bacterium CG_4_10_14_0_8_um_filter_58_22]|uniref:dTDP-4-dehydrorhamnose reductase n=1 Tax=Candidatus Uhrbacteria bacterium CG_4_10_14_0_8_um_filter_58_22 TaxID=1975029 RepID=A0A2M7Q9A3_9BACT|nr:MAG: dTDP-4-dehydrorhamnose reductase [Parcubacteria group bacterium CG1_02_58_44]PIY62168.1 MAG: dTDP-4-dehydrorhamnose reductase [Candidatus Uhrbacteria bacterium CG_4_10_14_0_8_um_filter_58_22]